MNLTERIEKLKNILKEFLEKMPKRKIEDISNLTEEELQKASYFAAEIINVFWNVYVERQIENQNWPRQCRDINKYLFETDLAEIINLKSIKSDLIELYKTLKTRLAVMYHQDKKLKISSSGYEYLAQANYQLLIAGFEEQFRIIIGEYKRIKLLQMDFESLTLKTGRTVDRIYYDDDDIETRITKTSVENDQTKRLLKRLNTK